MINTSYKINTTLVLLIISIVTFFIGFLVGYNQNGSIKIYTSTNYNMTVFNIFVNNIKIITINILGGFTFSALTTLHLLYNGIMIGYETKLALIEDNLMTILVLILPHGIFEVPAIIIAGAAGFKIPYEIIRYLMGKKEQPLTKEDIKEYFKLALISIILIVIAAFVEAYVTPKIAEYFLSNLD